MTQPRIGAYDPSAWDGLVFSDGPGRGFGLRFAIERDGNRLELYDLQKVVREVGPCAPDGVYARVSFGVPTPSPGRHRTTAAPASADEAGLTVEWSRVAERNAVARLTIRYDGVLEILGYLPWDWEGTWEIGDGPTATATDFHEHLPWYCGFQALSGDETSALDVRLTLLCPDDGRPEPETVLERDSGLLYRTSVKVGDLLYLSAELGDPGCLHPGGSHPVDSLQIDSLLATALDRYESGRVRVTGHWDGAAAAITNNLHWMVSLKPESGRPYTPAGRRWIFPKHGGGRDHWTIFCWDAFLNGLELAVESTTLARDNLIAVLETQYDNGNIPNWRGRFAGTPDRSQPPVGSFAVLKYFLRTRDRELLELAYPHLADWSRWWSAPKKSGRRRDGNANGLYEWGCDVDLLGDSPAEWENRASHHQMAAWESGQDDLPNWDDAQWMAESETLNLESVDLNSLLALDHECLARIAIELGLEDRAIEHDIRYRTLKDRINRVLWDEASGMYLDRYWDGRSSRRLAASNFYPLIAGVPCSKRATRMLTTLLDRTKFWGNFVLPTIARDDLAFQDQQYWRGTIWPPPNYLIYQGLRRYGFDEVAGELAASSADLFLRSWRERQLCRENYDSRTGEGGGQHHQSWGPLFALMAVEEFIDVTPWDGLRVGTLAPPPKSRLHNVQITDRVFEVELSPAGLGLVVDGATLLESRDAIVFRNLSFSRHHLYAETLSLEPARFSTWFGHGLHRVTVDGEAAPVAGNEIIVPGGRHRLEIRGSSPSHSSSHHA